MIKVIDKTTWVFGQNNMHMGGMIGQVTAFEWNGIKFYTRENLTGVKSFLLSSGERWGDKCCKTPRSERQSLELLAPDQHWPVIAELVKSMDPLKRPVLKTRDFNFQFIEKVFF